MYISMIVEWYFEEIYNILYYVKMKQISLNFSHSLNDIYLDIGP